MLCCALFGYFGHEALSLEALAVARNPTGLVPTNATPAEKRPESEQLMIRSESPARLTDMQT
jgi:hypothetical protein